MVKDANGGNEQKGRNKAWRRVRSRLETAISEEKLFGAPGQFFEVTCHTCKGNGIKDAPEKKEMSVAQALQAWLQHEGHEINLRELTKKGA